MLKLNIYMLMKLRKLEKNYAQYEIFGVRG